MSAERLARMRATLDRRQPDLQVLLDQVHKPHNLSAILRTCDAVGVAEAHAVTAAGKGFDLHRHSSAGIGQWVDVHTHEAVDEAVSALQARDLKVYAAHLSERAVDFRSVDYTRPCAVLLGAELHGVSAQGAELADEHVVIPMAGLGASLNVSVAGAVLLFEAQRQRAAAGAYDRPRLDAATYRRKLFEWMQPRIARYCRERGLAYPQLDEEGHVSGGLPQ
ncbi:tRNA (guanosine(18)-2'-O)-methyltransferase TrmH [Arhodomonas sp. AD133]|uniref:tRNA (guanosine(18)-2'-O)-methyltransferase TrmH n=1 Tax=Arhodomonas sp. AD133 TaxID=3415009 RepID=UPI003EBD4A69